MCINEALLIMMLKNLETNPERVLVLQKYVLRYGALSQEAGIKVREILAEGEK